MSKVIGTLVVLWTGMRCANPGSLTNLTAGSLTVRVCGVTLQ